MSEQRHRRRFVGRAAVLTTLALTCAALFVPGTAAAASRPTTFSLMPGSNCVGGSASDNATITLAWRDSAGALKAKAEGIQANSWGSWQYCNGAVVLEIGDQLKATVGSNVRRFTVPNVTFVVDRAADEFRGTAPAGHDVVFWFHAAIFADYYEEVQVAAGPDGTWSHTPESWYGIMGGIDANLLWQNARGDSIELYDAAPTITLNLGKPGFLGTARSGDEVVAELRNGTTGALRATGRASAGEWGAFAGKFRNNAGRTVAVMPGDRLVAPIIGADADWIVPNVEGAANPETERVRGRCFDTGNSAQTVMIQIVRAGRWIGFAIASTDDAGFFNVRFTGREAPWFDPANIRSGDRVQLACLQATGDWVRKLFVVP